MVAWNRCLSGWGETLAVAELRYGAIVADWGSPRRERVEAAIAATTVVLVTDALLSTMAELRAARRRLGHPLADPLHGNDLWVAATALHIGTALTAADQMFAGVPALVLVP